MCRATVAKRKNAVWKEDGWVCQYCGKPVFRYRRLKNRMNHPDLATVDHFVPRYLRKLLGLPQHDIENLVTACQECNHIRNEQMQAAQKGYSEWTYYPTFLCP